MGEPELAVEAPVEAVPAAPEPSATVQASESSPPLESEKFVASSAMEPPAAAPAEQLPSSEQVPIQVQPVSDCVPVVAGVNESGEPIISGMAAQPPPEPWSGEHPQEPSPPTQSVDAGLVEFSVASSQEAAAAPAPPVQAALPPESSAPTGEPPVSAETAPVLGSTESPGGVAAPEATQQVVEPQQQPAEQQQPPSQPVPIPSAEEPAVEALLASLDAKPCEPAPPVAPAENAEKPKVDQQPLPAPAEPEGLPPPPPVGEALVASSVQQEQPLAAPPSVDPVADPVPEPAAASAPPEPQFVAPEAPAKMFEAQPLPVGHGNPHPNPGESAGQPIPVAIETKPDETYQPPPVGQPLSDKPAWLPEGVLSPATEQKVIDFISAHELPAGADRSVNFQYQRQTETSHKQTTSGTSSGDVPAAAKETISANVPTGDLETLNKLQEQLKELGFANSPMSQMVTQQMGGPTGGHQVRFAMEGHHHRHVKTTTNSYQGTGAGAPLDQTQKQFQQQVQQLTGTGSDFATIPQTGSSSSDIREERVLPDGSKMIIHKTVSRTVKATHTVYQDGKPITTTIEHPIDANPNPQGSQPLIRLKVNQNLFQGVVDEHNHIQLLPMDSFSNDPNRPKAPT